MFDQSMAPELARNLIYTIGWPLLAAIAILPPFLYCKYGVGKPKYLRRIGEYLALRGLTLTAGRRSQHAHAVLDGALYTIRYRDAEGQEYEAVASVTPIAGVFIGEQKPLNSKEEAPPDQAPQEYWAPIYTPTCAINLPSESDLQHLLRLQEENRLLKHRLAELQSSEEPRRHSTTA
ncbi:hypothetical protein [Verrucomicrobium sp. BvORR106]|uniref:hypothetical protein n=1 Tax=Verrucomicrobium sp. BvORR106 TaxID=1403819 RepID=UPI000571B406|nr:hypothetical protein [Verrucomicrobium sp. BvORR106]